MRLKTILNRVQRLHGFVYARARMLEEMGRLIIEAEIRPRAKGGPICSGCDQAGPGYDTLATRRFAFAGWIV